MPDSAAKRFKPTRYIPVCTAAALLVGSSTLFFVFTCPWLSHAVSPVVPLYNGVVFLFVLANFSMATFMDPGVFPRASEDEDKDDDFRAPLYKNVEVKSIQVRMKWCSTCHFYRPPRCSHCSVCDNCVEDFDHHCPWVNNCIGRRNYRYFFLFLLSLSSHMVGVFTFGLIYVLHHLEKLTMLHTTVTMIVMCVAGLFFIPVMGLTGFHMVLVARGRTTNEQVTGKFRGGVNPFTRGCCGNVKHVLCSPLAPRYVVDPVKKANIVIKPPFFRPSLSDRSIIVKVSDNGVHTNILRTKSKSSLDDLGEKSGEVQPPLPPKAERHHHLHQIQNHLTSSEDSSLSSKPTAPSTPAMYKFRPSFGTMPKVHYHATGEKIAMSDDCKSPILEERSHDYRSEPNLDLPDYGSADPPLHRHFLSSPFQLDSYSLKRARRTEEPVKLGGAKPESVTSTPHRGVFSPGMVSSRNGSLSYDSLLAPGVAVAPSLAFHSSYLPPKTCHVRRAEPQRQVFPPSPYSPVHAGFMYARERERERDSSPVRYDNLSQTIMASIQERKELEERERLLLHHGHGHAHAQMYANDSGIFDGHYPPCRGSRDELSQVGVMSYGPRVHHASASSLLRAHATSTSSLHAEGGTAHHRSPSHQPRLSPSLSPRSPSLSHHKFYMERAESPHGSSREDPVHGKVNGQAKARECHLVSPSGMPLSPSRHATVKKVTGVGGTTYEISV